MSAKKIERRHCPHCAADLRGEKIPEETLKFYNPPDWDVEADGQYPYLYFGRTIGVVVDTVYDGVLYYQCPDCRGAWNRWTKDDRRWAAALKHMPVPEHMPRV